MLSRLGSIFRKLTSGGLGLLDLVGRRIFLALVLTLTWPMQVTLGEVGSGLSKPQPRFLPVVGGNMGEAWALRKLGLGRRRRLREVEREESLGLAGLRMDLEGSFMEEERREVKQMKSSPPALLFEVGRWGLSVISIIG